MLSGLSFSLTFLYGIKSLILCGFHLASFHLAEASVFAFSLLHTLVCAVVNVSKLWNNNRTVHVNKIKTKTKPSTSNSNWSPVLLFDLAHKQCKDIGIVLNQHLRPETLRPETLRPGTLRLGTLRPGTQNTRPWDLGTCDSGTLGHRTMTSRALELGPWDMGLWQPESWEQDPENWACDTDS